MHVIHHSVIKKYDFSKHALKRNLRRVLSASKHVIAFAAFVIANAFRCSL
jgi:transposase